MYVSNLLHNPYYIIKFYIIRNICLVKNQL